MHAAAFVLLLLLGLVSAAKPVAKRDPCPKGFTQHGQKCYLVSADQKNWPEAQTACEGMGANLAAVESEDERMTVEKLLEQQKDRLHPKFPYLYYGFWIGANRMDDRQTFRWFKSSGQNPRVTYWPSFKNIVSPDTFPAMDCVRIYSARYNYKWVSFWCWSPFMGYICDTPVST